MRPWKESTVCFVFWFLTNLFWKEKIQFSTIVVVSTIQLLAASQRSCRIFFRFYFHQICGYRTCDKKEISKRLKRNWIRRNISSTNSGCWVIFRLTIEETRRRKKLWVLRLFRIVQKKTFFVLIRFFWNPSQELFMVKSSALDPLRGKKNRCQAFSLTSNWPP